MIITIIKIYTFYGYTFPTPDLFELGQWFKLSDCDNFLFKVKLFYIVLKQTQPKLTDTLTVTLVAKPHFRLKNES